MRCPWVPKTLGLTFEGFEDMFEGDFADMCADTPQAYFFLSSFCKKQRKEVAILHSEECLDFDNCCQDLPGWYCKGDEPLGDQYGIYHLRLSNCIRNGEVTWSNVMKKIQNNVTQTHE
jgi:hypothetical protein